MVNKLITATIKFICFLLTLFHRLRKNFLSQIINLYIKKLVQKRIYDLLSPNGI